MRHFMSIRRNTVISSNYFLEIDFSFFEGFYRKFHREENMSFFDDLPRWEAGNSKSKPTVVCPNGYVAQLSALMSRIIRDSARNSVYTWVRVIRKKYRDTHNTWNDEEMSAVM